MNTKVIGISIAAFIGIVVLASVLMPILDDATAKTDTYTNDGYFYMDEIDSDTTRTISWDHTKPNQITIDSDHVIELPTNVSATVVCSGENWLVRHSPGSLFQLYISSGGVSASVNDGTDMTISISGGTLTATNTASTPATKSVTFTDGFCITYEKAGYVMKKSDAIAYMNADSPILGMGRSNIGTTSGVAILVKGTVESVTISEVSSYSATFGTPTIVVTEDAEHDDLYELQKITFTGTVGGTTADLTYSYFIVPSEVTAERTVHFNDNQNALFSAIPLLIIVAILLGVVALVIRSRMN